ncbi:MAG: hypothetical protein ABI878_10510 [Acidobacteriota bacterium]
MMDIKAVFNVLADLRPSTIRFKTSRSAEATGSDGAPTLGACIDGVKLEDIYTGKTAWLNFYGVGSGVSFGFGNLGISGSTQDMPSFGSNVLKGTTNWGDLELSDLTGGGIIYSFGLMPVGGSLIFFNTIGASPFIPPVIFKAALWAEGLVLGTPGGSLMTYIGLWKTE